MLVNCYVVVATIVGVWVWRMLVYCLDYVVVAFIVFVGMGCYYCFVM